MVKRVVVLVNKFAAIMGEIPLRRRMGKKYTECSSTVISYPVTFNFSFITLTKINTSKSGDDACHTL